MQVFGEHDNDFKQLNSQLLKECAALDWTSGQAHSSASYQPSEVSSSAFAADICSPAAEDGGRALQARAAEAQRCSCVHLRGFQCCCLLLCADLHLLRLSYVAGSGPSLA